VTEQFNTAGSSQLGANQILTAPTVQLLYDNPLALFRGAPGAPRLAPWALEASTTAGDTVRYQDPRTFRTTSGGGNNDAAFIVTVMAEGGLRLKFGQGGVNSTAVLFRLRAGAVTTINSWNRNGSSIARSEDLTVEYGDTYYLEHRTTGTAGTDQVFVSDFRLCTDGGYFWVLPPGMVFDLTEPV
jgi:hypothetical protein